MEHYLDELLDACGLSRVHVIYSGGGHCYLLLPNTSLVQQSLTDWNHRFNCWLQEQFGVQLFLANGWELCSADTLCNCPAEQSPYKALFQRVNALADQHKQHPCTAADLLALNRSVKDTDGTRECRICGISSNLDSNDRCPWCRLFAQLSGQIQSQQPVFLVSRSWQPDSFRLPGADGAARFVSLISPADAAACKDRVRRYTKNKAFDGLSDAVNLYIGDYAASNDMAELSEQAQGIRRIAICRMDVDNLGQAFISGFECPDETNPVQKCGMSICPVRRHFRVRCRCSSNILSMACWRDFRFLLYMPAAMMFFGWCLERHIGGCAAHSVQSDPVHLWDLDHQCWHWTV